MSNLKDYARGRNDGLAMALRIVESEGIEGLRKEIKFRGVTGIHTALAKKRAGRSDGKNQRNDLGHHGCSGGRYTSRRVWIWTEAVSKIYGPNGAKSILFSG